MTIGVLLRLCKRQLQTTSPTPALDAQVLLMHALELDPSALIMHEDRELSTRDCDRVTALVNERCKGRPVAHIVGHREFWSLDFRVSADALIPRPDTEVLVELALSHVTSGDTIVDLGTGTGAIAIAIAHERPDVHVVATDVSDNALELARDNARALSTPNVRFIRSHWFEALSGQTFNMVISNPPYIAKDDPHLRDGDVRFDPHQALVADDAGLADLKTIIDSAASYLTPSGKLVVEHGYTQGDAVREQFRLNAFKDVATVRDYGGNERVTAGTRALQAG